MAIRKTLKEGFTLVELMIVVAIVGVLSVIAVVAYGKLRLNSKVTEAQNNIGAIRVAQEDYKVDHPLYANLGVGLCPNSASGTTQVKWAWDPSCSGGTKTWRELPAHIEGPVQFGYATVALPASMPATFVNFGSANVALPWYVIMASADLNNDGAGGLKTELVGSSFEKTIYARQEGE